MAYRRYIVELDIGTIMSFDSGERRELVHHAKVYEMDDKYVWPRKATPYQLISAPKDDNTRERAMRLAQDFIVERERQWARKEGEPVDG